MTGQVSTLSFVYPECTWPLFKKGAYWSTSVYLTTLHKKGIAERLAHRSSGGDWKTAEQSPHFTGKEDKALEIKSNDGSETKSSGSSSSDHPLLPTQIA
jgi:hypothetical protein